MEIVIRENTASTNAESIEVIFKKMQKAVKQKAKSMNISTNKYLTVRKYKKNGPILNLLWDFSRASLGPYVKQYNSYKIYKPTGMNIFAFIYLMKMKMLRWSKKEGWMIRSYRKEQAKPKESNHLKWKNYVYEMFPRLSEDELKSLEGGILRNTVHTRFAKQYGGKGGWCQIGQYENSPGVYFVQCYNKQGKIVFWEDVNVISKIATIVKFKPSKISSKRPQKPKILKDKPVDDMDNKELYQYLYNQRGEYIKKVPGEPAGGWKIKNIPYNHFSEGLKRKFLKKAKGIGWVLIE